MSREGYRWVVPGEGQVRLEPFAIPEPGAGEIRVRTEASLVSAGTELAIYTGIHQGLTNPHVTWPKYPQVQGYMAVVTVDAVGSGVDTFRVGDRLLTSTGHVSHSLLSAAEAAITTWRLPATGAAHRLVFARMAKTAATALTRVDATFTQSLAVAGLGIIGQVTLRLFEAAGAWPIVGIDPVSFRREAALRGGAAAVVDPGAGSTCEQLHQTLPGGADIVIDATGWASALPEVMSLARDGGSVVVLGSPRGAAQDVDFYRDLHRRSLKVVGAHDSGIGADLREYFPYTNDRVVPAVVDWVARGKVPVDDLISHHVAAEQLDAMYAGLLDDKDRFLGVVLDWSGVAS